MSDPPEHQETSQQSTGTSLVSAEATARVGSRIGDYEITGVTGGDETGVLYSGRHVVKGGQVTLEILHDHCARKKDLVEQFMAETRAVRPVGHRNVADITDLGVTPEGTVFLVMEHLRGESLRSRMRQRQRLPPFEAINVMRQAAQGLGAAHDAGIVHGALKPDNIFLCKHKGRRRIVRRSKAMGMRYAVKPEASYDQVKLLDFGMARLIHPIPGEEVELCGTLHYLSPEQAQGQPADQRSDIYSLGAVFYEMITGTVPFGGDSLSAILEAHAMGGAIPPSRRAPGAGIDVRIDALILRCLKKSPLLRFASTGELDAALDACITDCAFLRDAHRLPGITESGIDLSEGLPQARQDPEQSSAPPPAAATVVEKPVAAPAPTKPEVSPVLRIAPPVVSKPAAASLPPEPTRASIVEKAATLPSAQAATEASTVDDPAIAPIAPPPAAQAEDPAAALVAPPPAEQEGDPAAALVTPPPAAQAEDLVAAIGTPPPLAAAVETPEDISNVEAPPARLAAETDVRPDRSKRTSSHRSRVFALVGLLLLGGGIAVWTTHDRWVPATTKPVTPRPTAPVPVAAPSPPPSAAAPVAAPAPPVAEDTNVAASAAAPPSPAPPARLDRAATGGSGKHAAPRARATHAKRPRRATRAVPVPPPAAPALTAEPTTESEPPAPSEVTSAPAPGETANAGALLKEAQRVRKRGRFTAAISKAREALEAEPTPAQVRQAYELICVCSCLLGDASAARAAAEHLVGRSRDLVKATCEEMGQPIE